MNHLDDYDVIVVGAGHAGIEAAHAAAMLGARTAVFTISLDFIGNMPCNPAIGGTAKGHLVRELDALGGLMGRAADETYLQSRMLNRGKGPAVHSLRVQTDRKRYHMVMKHLLEQTPNLYIHQAEITGEAADFLADIAGGDARSALNAIELGVLTTEPSGDGRIHLTLEVMSECIQKRTVRYDKTGDNHYDTISAFIKSMRGSDPDAALYYLAKMIYAGEDPKFIARRVVICASEDVGNADPHALQVAVSAMQAVNFIGMPEGRIPLAQAVTYVACAPKSNAAYLGIDKALSDVRNIRIRTVPPHLKDSHYSGAKELEHGVGYKYAHDYPGHYVKQQYLPDELVGTVYYAMTENGVERRMKEHLRRLKGE